MADSGVDEFQQQFERLRANIEKFIRGKSEVVRLALSCLLAEGHLLLEAVPGVAKTSLARAVAQSVAGRVRRIQFTPDLQPSDVTGVQVYDPDRKQFVFREGPVFANIVIGDGINRASPKAQSALLEVMAERQVTVDGKARRVPRPFLCIATQSPADQLGTHVLPEALLDRFTMRIDMGYPDARDEVDIVGGGLDRSTPDRLDAVMTSEDMLQMIRMVQYVEVSPPLRAYVVAVTRTTRELPEVRLGASPRASIALAVCAQARAASQGRSFATTEDVKELAVPVLNHRLVLTPDAVAGGAKPEVLLEEILSRTPVPQN